VSLVGELLLLRSRGSVQTLYLPLQLGATLTTLKLSDADPCGGGPSDRVRRLVMFDGCFGADAPANAAIRLATLQPRDVLVTAGSSVRQQQRPSADGTDHGCSAWIAPAPMSDAGQGLPREWTGREDGWRG
jgi:hypothetical protein